MCVYLCSSIFLYFILYSVLYVMYTVKLYVCDPCQCGHKKEITDSDTVTSRELEGGEWRRGRSTLVGALEA